MLEIVPYRAEHMIDLVEMDEGNARRAVEIENNMRHGGYARAVLHDGRCVAVGGGMYLYGKLYHLWAEISAEMKADRKVTMHRLARQLFADFTKVTDWQRLEVVCQTDLIPNCRWVEAFGLKPVLIEEKAGPNGETMTRFARVR